MKNKPGTFPLHSKPAYSTISFTLLAAAISNVTGISYEESVEKYIAKPLNLSKTGPKPISEEGMVIAPNNNSETLWEMDFGVNNPGGGYFSSSHDLAVLARSILNPDPEFISQQTVDAWLKPISFGTKIGEAVGYPWEITRTDKLSNRTIVDIYAKDGGIFGYTSRFAVIPSHGIGFVILVSGEGFSPVTALAEALLDAVYPVIDDEATKEVEAAGYTQKFTSGNDSWIEFEIDEQGLKLKSLWARGVDSFAFLKTKIFGESLQDLRPYPTGAIDGDNEEWRLSFNINMPTADIPSKNVYGETCYSWTTVDSFQYGGQALDRLFFKKRNGKVVGVELPGWRLSLKK